MNALKHAPRGRRSAASSVITGLVCLLGLAGTAQAALVVVDPDSADNLADISNFFAGVTLSAFGGSTTDGKVYSLDPGSCCAPPTPPPCLCVETRHRSYRVLVAGHPEGELGLPGHRGRHRLQH